MNTSILYAFIAKSIEYKNTFFKFCDEDHRKMKRFVYNVREDRKLKLEKAALEVGNKLGRPINWTKIVEILLDKHIQDGVESLLYEERVKESGQKMN